MYNIQSMALHYAGNKTREERLILSKSLYRTDDEMDELLAAYFLNSFKSPEYFQFFHEGELNLNEVYVYVNRIFEDPDSLYDQSVLLAKHLYEKSLHPNVKGGEFYTVYFKDIDYRGQKLDAVGLFKSETKDTFLKVHYEEQGILLNSQEGIHLKKPDKGCLIFNIEAENGFIVSIVDNTNKGSEAQYWTDEFLHVKQRKDSYYKTENLLHLCKNFVTEELPRHFEVNRADQADLLNKSVKFFKEKEDFDFDEFTGEVMVQPEIINTFSQYKSGFEQANDIEFSNNFSISENAVKKQSKIFKSVIKLDKNFHIYIHGNREMVEQGSDEFGRKYYKLYYDNES